MYMSKIGRGLEPSNGSAFVGACIHCMCVSNREELSDHRTFECMLEEGRDATVKGNNAINMKDTQLNNISKGLTYL